MQTFDTDVVFDPEKARLDKIELRIGEWCVEAINVQMNSFLIWLGREREEIESYKFIQADNDVTDRHVRYLNVISPKQGNGYKNNAPLFGGKLKVQRISETHTSNRYMLTLQLSINPTRFCVYQPPPRRVRDGDSIRRILPIEPTLFARQDINRYKSEYSLDGKDNVILKPVAKSNASDAFWDEQINRYITSIRDCLFSEMRNFPQEGFRVEEPTHYYSIRSVEAYWEFETESALEKIRLFEDAFCSSINNASVSTYPNGSSFTELNAKGLRGDIRKGQRVTIYAKTNKRIRVEVKHDYKINSALRECRTLTTNSIDSLMRVFEEAISQSSLVLTELFEHIRNYTNTSPLLDRNSAALVTLVYRCAGTIELGELLLTLICENGGFPTKNIPSELRSPILMLESKGVLVRRGRPINRYTIHGHFRNARLALLKI